MISVKQYLLFIFITLALFFTGNVYAQEKAYPKNGEGITLFLQRFHRTGSTYQKEFLELNKGKFGKNNSLLRHVKYTLPPLHTDKKKASKSTAAQGKKKTASKSTADKASSSRNRKNNTEPLFGKSLAKYTVNSSILKGATFYLVSGHGGPDPGAIGTMGKHKLHEDEYAYDIMLRLARNLLMRGANVEIIIQDAKDGIRDQQFLNNSKRETCMGNTIPLNQVKRLQQRCSKINTLSKKNKSTYKRAIFIHVDSRSKNKRTDVFFYHQNNNKYSKRLAKNMKSTFANKYKRHQPGRGFSGTVAGRNLYVLRHTIPTSVFVELGNIQNSYDQQRIILSNNRQALANWLCEGFVKDYHYNK